MAEAYFLTGSDRLTVLLGRLWRQLTPRRQQQFFPILGLTLMGAVAELLTLGTVFPFLAFIADPERIHSLPWLERVLAALGLKDLREILLSLTLVFVAAAMTAGMIRALLAWATNKYVFTLGHELGAKVYEQILHQPYSFHVSQNTSAVISALQKVQIVTVGVFLPLLSSVSGMIVGVPIVVALFLFAPLVSLAVFGGLGGIYFGISLATRSMLLTNAKTIARMQSERIRTVQEGLGGIRDILINNTQSVFLEDFRTFDADMRRAQATNALIGTIPRLAVEVAGIAIIAVIAFLLTARDGGGLGGTLPLLGTFALGGQRLLPLMQVFYTGWTQIVGNSGNINDLLEILERPTRFEERDQAESIAFEKAIAFRDVSFCYPGEREAVLRNFDLVIPKGMKVCLVGKTGSGKSTAADILMGLLAPTSGRIEIDGNLLDARTSHAWQRRIAHVPQAIFLRDASIAENIAFGIEPAKIDFAQVRKAALLAGLGEFIESLPEGYRTSVGERGILLSGGQRQQIGIARAFLKQMDVLVFDEATSALDAKTEAAILNSIGELPGVVTLVVIAHKMTAKLRFDRIITLVNGRVLNAPERVAEPALDPAARHATGD